jgi:N utilization substance protein B
MASRRRRSREECFKALYRMQVADETAATAIDSLRADPALDSDVADYAAHLVTLTDVNREEIDAIITESLDRWDLERVAQTDRAVLRMGVAELMYCSDVPLKVVIDEAIEIAKRYGTPASGRFVNGVLDNVARTRRAP